MSDMKLSEMDYPTVLNRETGKEEPLFIKKTAMEDKGIKAVFSVNVPEEIKKHLFACGIDSLDLGNKEHVKCVYAYFYEDVVTKEATTKPKEDIKEPKDHKQNTAPKTEKPKTKTKKKANGK